MAALGVVAVFVVLAFVGLSAFFGLVHFSKRANVKRTFDEVAKRLGGSNSSYGISYSVFFRSDGTPFQIRGYQRDQPVLRISAGWKDSYFRLKLFPEQYSEGLKKFLGMQDLKIGSEKFDARFVIQSNDEHILSEVLTPEIQALITEMRDVNLTIVGGDMSVERTMSLDDAGSIVRLAKQFVETYFAMISAESINLDLTIVIRDSATCMVCGDQIQSDSVSCLSCSTPHHEECWLYLGQCSTYGCGQVNYHRSKVG